MLTPNFTDQTFRVSSNTAFKQAALKVFAYQYQHNPIYQQFANAIGKTPNNVNNIIDIPYLPISFFKTHQVITTTNPPPKEGLGEVPTIFESSGTTQSNTSKHYVKDISVYEKSFITNFEQVYGNIDQYCIIALLPSYLERQNASLVYMVKELIYKSKHAQSGFYIIMKSFIKHY